MEFELLQFTAQAPEIEKTEEDFITALLEKFVMNVTALNSYLDCPLGFYYKNLIRIPSGKSEARIWKCYSLCTGKVISERCRKVIMKSFPSKEEMMADFKWYMNKHRENFTKEAFDRKNGIWR